MIEYRKNKKKKKTAPAPPLPPWRVSCSWGFNNKNQVSRKTTQPMSSSRTRLFCVLFCVLLLLLSLFVGEGPRTPSPVSAAGLPLLRRPDVTALPRQRNASSTRLSQILRSGGCSCWYWLLCPCPIAATSSAGPRSSVNLVVFHLPPVVLSRYAGRNTLVVCPAPCSGNNQRVGFHASTPALISGI